MSSNRKKLLLIGRSGSGKSSMRSIIFSNYSAVDTRRLAATIDVEHSHLRFLGNMTLNLWDCGGQNVFIENYLTTQRDHIFRMVEVLIYVFDIGSKEVPKDIDTFMRCLENLREFSPNAKVFVLLHKMDLVRADRRDQVVDGIMKTLVSSTQQYNFELTGFATSIWDESLYKAWSTIVCSMVPNIQRLQNQLDLFLDATQALEVILFERTTFLVISHAAVKDLQADPKRFEKISNIIKSYRQSCSKMGSQLQSVTLEGGCTAVVDTLTPNAFMMVVFDGHIKTALALADVKASRHRFEQIEQEASA